MSNTYVIQTESGKEEYAKSLLESLTPLRDRYDRIWIPQKNYVIRRRQPSAEQADVKEDPSAKNGREAGGATGPKHKIITRKILYPGYLFLDAEDQTAFITGLRQYPLDTFYDVLGKRMTDIKIVRKEELFFIQRLSDPEVSQGKMVDKRIHFITGPLVGLEGYVRRVDRHKLQVQLAIPFLGEEKLVWCAWDEVSSPASPASGEE